MKHIHLINVNILILEEIWHHYMAFRIEKKITCTQLIMYRSGVEHDTFQVLRRNSVLYKKSILKLLIYQSALHKNLTYIHFETRILFIKNRI